MKKRILIVTLLIFAAKCIFCIGIKDMSDWEKEIKRLDYVESVEYELSNPYDDDCYEYNMKIRLTKNRCLEIRYFIPYGAKRRPGEFHIVRIGNIVPVALYYEIEETLFKIEKTKYDLYFKSFSFNYLNSYIEGEKGIIDLIKNYDKYFVELNQLPDYSENFSKDEVIDINGGDSSASEIWNKYSSPYIHKIHYKDEYHENWREYKMYKMTVEEYNNYNLSTGWENRVLEENL